MGPRTGPGLTALPWAAASLPILALAVALFALRLEKRRDARLAMA